MFFSIIILIILIYLTVNRSKIKGAKGEKRVNSILKDIPDSKILNNIMLKTEMGTSQIDHILINSKGIFVIETKNYDGWIFGNEKAKYWTQIIYKKKSKFLNPIRQNYGHIKTIEEYLPNKKEMFHSTIVFSNKCEFKKLEVTTHVLKVGELKKFLNNFKSSITLTNADINYYFMILQKNNITDETERKNHIKRIRESNT